MTSKKYFMSFTNLGKKERLASVGFYTVFFISFLKYAKIKIPYKIGLDIWDANFQYSPGAVHSLPV